MKRTLVALGVMLAACSSAPRVPGVRFSNAPPVRIVNDRTDVPKTPKVREFLHGLYHYDGVIHRRLTRAMELPRQRRALGVNAYDEVPDSTWFTNRIGVRELSLDELRRGPARIESPELYKPWTVKSTKIGGTEVGFVIIDARGEKFLLKFDPLAFPEQETGAHVIIDRLLWAVGYNTTEDFIVDLKRSDLIVPPTAYIQDEDGKKEPLTRAELDARFAQVNTNRDGTIRALASHWLAGKTIGGHPAEGVRSDDPNDRIPHELRRELRGLYAFSAWLDHVDIQEGNFLDAWVTDPVDPNRHYVKHYLIDFGKSLGVMATTGRDPRHGYEYVFDFAKMGKSLFTAGTLERPWERRGWPDIRGIGLFDAPSFDPGTWHPDSPAYVPFLTADRLDKFWATKILMRFTRAQLRAVVEQARYSDPRATDYLVDTLVARQRTSGEYWFARVNPLDAFTVADGGVCFDDLWLRYGFGGAADTTYRISAFDRDARSLAPPAALAASPTGHTCTTALPRGTGADAYTIVEIATNRPGLSGRTLVHLARDPARGEQRVIGIWRP